MAELLILGLACATITVTLCKAPIFSWLRKLLKRARVLECLYCTSHWVAALLVRPETLQEASRVFAVVALAAPGMWVINWAHNNMTWGSGEHDQG